MSNKKQYICHSYIPGNGLSQEAVSKINFKQITHINIAFSLIEKDDKGNFIPVISKGVLDGLKLVQEEVKNQDASSKMLISIGGYAAGNFCEASADESSRSVFAKACKQILDDTKIDGIDLDWEYPGYDTGGISFCKNCRTDYVLLCKEIRKEIGNKRLLTSAVGSHLFKDMDYKELNELFDYVNVMTYDMNNRAHSAFSKTYLTMMMWSRFAFDKEKLVLGIPFYARCKNEEYEWKGYSELMKLVDDGKAKMYHSIDQEYVVIDGNKLSLDTPESIEKKVEWVKKHGFGGVFNWQELTDRKGELRAAMAKVLD